MKMKYVMKEYGIIIFSLLFYGLILSCSKDDEQTIPEEPKTEDQAQNNNQEEEVRYYVKYEIEIKHDRADDTMSIEFTSEKGKEKVSGLAENWSGTYGPVKKGFKASLACSISTIGYRKEIHGRIYVCREIEPFVIKAEGRKDGSLGIYYTIDF